MLHALLNSGKITQYKYIAQDGFAIYEKAKSFRDALIKAPEVGPAYVKYLAVPSYDPLDGHIDWFTPNESRSSDGEYQIVKWSAASDDEKRAAYAKLKQLEDVLKVYGRRLISRGASGDMLVLAHFLTGNQKGNILPAIHFPNQDCVFIVDGEPVITFWGFIENDASIDISPLSRLSMPQGRVQATIASASASAAAAAGAPNDNSNEKRGHSCALFPHWKCLLLGLLLLLLLPLLLWLLSKLFNFNLPFFNPALPDLPSISAPDINKTPVNTEAAADKTVHTADAVDVTAPSVPVTSAPQANLDALDAPVANIPDLKAPAVQNPLDALTGTQAETAAGDNSTESDAPVDSADESKSPESQDNAPAADNNAVSDKGSVGNVNPFADGALSIDPAAVQKGDLSSLNGHWQTKSGLMDTNSGKPLNLSYDHKDNVGQLTITRQDGVKCTVGSKASNDNGAVSITPDGAAVCKDNVTYQMPDIKCSQQSDGSTRCFGQYDNQSAFPIRIFKN